MSNLAGLSRSKARAEAESMVFARAKWAARVHILLPCCHLSARFFQNGSDFLLALFFIPTPTLPYTTHTHQPFLAKHKSFTQCHA